LATPTIFWFTLFLSVSDMFQSGLMKNQEIIMIVSKISEFPALYTLSNVYCKDSLDKLAGKYTRL